MQYMHGQDYEYFISDKIKLTDAGKKGLGVYAREPIPGNEIVEVCPVMLLKYDKRLKWSWLKRFYRAAIVTIFDDYLWWWRMQKSALLLGYGNLYNHSDNFNTEVYRGHGRKFIFVTKGRVEPGEELTIHYGMQPFCFQDAEKQS